MTYTVHLAVRSDDGSSSYTFTVEEGDAPVLAAGPVVLDGASLGWSFSGEDWPTVLQASTGVVQLLAQDVADLAGLDTAQAVALVVLDSSLTAVGRLFGRVSELTADHVRRPDPANPAVDILWTRYTLGLVDYLPSSDLPAYDDAFTTGPVNDLLGHLSDTSNGIGDLDVDVISTGGLYGGPGGIPNPYQVTGGTWSSGTKIAEIQGRVLPLAIAPTPNGEDSFYVVTPVVLLDPTDPTPDPPPIDHVGLLQLRGPFSRELPCTLSFTDGVMRLAPLAGRPNCLDAGRIAESGQWRRDGARSVGAVTISRPTADARTTVKRSGAGRDYRTREIEADLTTAAAATQLAQAYLTAADDEVTPAWELESFTLRPLSVDELADDDEPVPAYRDFWVPGPFCCTSAAAADDFTLPYVDYWPYDPAATERYYLNYTEDGQVDRPAPPAYRVPVVIFGLQEAANLTGQSDRYVGTLSGATMTIQGGQVSVRFALRRRIPRPERDDSFRGPVTNGATSKDASFSYMRTAGTTRATVTYRGAAPVVDPTMTYQDFGLVRRV